MSTVTRPPSAPFDARFSAYLIDGLILFALFSPLMWSTFLARDINLWPLVLWWVGTHLYWAAFWSRLGRGQTPGMRIRRIRVVREDGGDLDFGHSLLRATLLFFGAGTGIVPLSIILDRDGVGLHDRLAGSRVIRTVKNAEPSQPRRP
jgi:uncharacterized RDD family membrane protein YckC